jgi:transglutaminase-like putative cysteine protease
MRIKIFHRTRYLYRAPVTDNHNEIRLRPATEDRERLEFFMLSITPSVRLRHYRDAWLNYVHYFDIAEPHMELKIEANSVIKTSCQYAGGKPTGMDFEQLAGYRDDLLRPFLCSSRYVDLSPEVWRQGVDVRDDRKDVFETAEAVMNHIHQTWTYAPNTTSSSTHMREVLDTRRGVCQDFAHVMIGICRALGIPARYVSGYLYNGPEALLRGAQASHAWCEVFIPERGWFGLDPTNNLLADERHVKIATGRDYSDAAPVSGSFDGPPGAAGGLTVELEVRAA